MLTGKYPWRCGVPGNSSAPPPESLVDLASVTEAAPSHELPSKEVTFAELFKSGGYATAHVGKWHLGYRPGSKPQHVFPVNAGIQRIGLAV